MALSNFGQRFWLRSHGVTDAEYDRMTPHQRLGRVLVLQMEAEMAQMKRGLEILNRPPQSGPIPIRIVTEIQATERD